MPAESRNTVRDRWYRNAPDEIFAHLNDSQALFLQQSGIVYKTDQPWRELH
ncbi:MAG: fatty acid cis/trans isomerase [Methylovulum sp.]|nr:fatty acid cis/trans isomerase [Methylovulum sp.]